EAFSERLQTKAKDLDDQTRDYLNRIVNSTKRMRDLINDLLNYSRISTKARPFVPVDLTAVATAAIFDLEGHIQQTGGRVETDSLPTIEADAMQMRQLLNHLVGNALKFRRPEAPPLVQIAAVQRGHIVTISVSDNGIGFEEVYLDRIFNVFQRLH